MDQTPITRCERCNYVTFSVCVCVNCGGRVPQWREPDDALQLLLLGAWVTLMMQNINAFVLLGSNVMQQAGERYRSQVDRYWRSRDTGGRPSGQPTSPAADAGESVDTA